MKNKILVFFIIGFVLYLIDVGLNNYDDKEIFISDSEITSLITAWRSQVGRNPNDDEVARIINDLVQEEILYREALKLGLDQDDRIIKRRLAQKLSFLKQESVEKLPSSQELKDFFNDLTVLDWGDLVDFDMIINATSIGLKKEDDFVHDFSQFGKNKFFYDVIYDPHKTKFFNIGNHKGNNFENGLNMFLFQAQKAFNIWHDINPIVNDQLIKFLKS